jgi:hypothetical protein
MRALAFLPPSAETFSTAYSLVASADFFDFLWKVLEEGEKITTASAKRKRH